MLSEKSHSSNAISQCSAESSWHRKCQRIVTTSRVFTLPFVVFFSLLLFIYLFIYFHVRPLHYHQLSNHLPSPPPSRLHLVSPLLNLSLPSGLHFYSSHVDHTVSDSGWQLFTQSRAIFKAALPLKERWHLKYLSPRGKKKKEEKKILTHTLSGYLCFWFCTKIDMQEIWKSQARNRLREYSFCTWATLKHTFLRGEEEQGLRSSFP